MNIQSWGEAKERNVYLVSLTKGKLKALVTNYGAALVSLWVPDRNGEPVDVVLGFDSLEAYLFQKSFLGVVVGRCANRIQGSRFAIDGKEYLLEANEGQNHLHSGSSGFSNAVWDIVEQGDDFVLLKHFSPDGDGGYPGNLECTVEYRLGEDRLDIRYQGISDQDTVLNLTNHSYFNLNGHDSGTVEDHMIMIDADQFTEIGEDCCSTGKILFVENTPLDLRKVQRVGNELNSDYYQMRYGSGYDFNYVLNHRDEPDRPVADLYSDQSGIGMRVITDLEGMHFYTGNHLEGTAPGKNGAVYGKNGGLCFETQHFPNAVNIPDFPSMIIKKGEKVLDQTVFSFYTK